MLTKTALSLIGATSLVLGACSLLVDTSDLSGGPSLNDAGSDTAAALDAPAGETGASTDASGAPDADASALSAYAATILADRPAAYYRFEETSGTVAADATGSGLDATYGANVHLGVPGLIGGGLAAHFDGDADGGFPHFVYRVAATGLEPTTALTVEAWISADYSNENVNLISYGNDNAAPYEPWVLYLSDGVPSAYIVSKGNPTGVGTHGLSTVTPGVPHHLAMTYDGSSLRVFVDGVETASGNASGDLTGYDSSGLGIGSGADGIRNVFDGVIDEVAVYPTALAPETLAAHAAAGRP